LRRRQPPLRACASRLDVEWAQRPVGDPPVCDDPNGASPVASGDDPRKGDETEGTEGDSDGLGGRTRGGGLRPPGESSVAPNGMPDRPTGDKGFGAPETAVVLWPAGAHVPEAVPVVPPPSNGAVASIGVPELTAVPEHVVTPTAAEPNGDTPSGGGLSPGAANSPAPSGIPAGPTGAPGPTPSGDVTPRGEGGAPTWAGTGVEWRISAHAEAIAALARAFTAGGEFLNTTQHLNRLRLPQTKNAIRKHEAHIPLNDTPPRIPATQGYT